MSDLLPIILLIDAILLSGLFLQRRKNRRLDREIIYWKSLTERGNPQEPPSKP